LETSFWFQGFELKTQADIDAVQKQCDFVFIDVSKQTKVPQYVARGTGYTPDYLEKVQAPAKRSSFKQEIKKAEVVHRKTSGLVKSFMEEVKFGRPINAVVAKKAVAYCVDSVLNAPDALMLMTHLRSRDEYTAQHSMNVCIYAIALGRQINLPVEELNNVGLCGMMHDMGKMQVPLEILNKPGRLTPEELTIMQSHAAKGWKILMSTSGMYAGAVDVAHTHHERLDGNGYPRKLKAEQITPYARMVAIVDMYDAVSSDRVYQTGRAHLDAIKY
jgi:HD-GYP domain-containing protein (c-di-GMP phosphodiesterase class II)